MLINAMRGHAAEFGVVAAKGLAKISELLQRARAAEAGVPALAMLALLASQLDALDTRLKTIQARLMAWHKEDPVSQWVSGELYRRPLA
jgi:transposase